MMFTRRTFFAGALWIARPRGVVLEAISGPILPHRLAVPDLVMNDPSGVFELREYRCDCPVSHDRLHEALSHCGARPLRWDRGERSRYLFRFDSLAARAEIWTLFASDPAWCQIRDGVNLTSVSIYRAL
jgi:hypothetical protein